MKNCEGYLKDNPIPNDEFLCGSPSYTEEKMEIVASISIDTSEVVKQINEISDLLVLKFRSFESLPESVLNELSAVVHDVIFSDAYPAGGAGLNIIHGVRLGTKYERFTAALRTGEFNVEAL